MLKHAVIASIAIATAGCASFPEGDPKMDAALKRFEPRPEVASVYIYCDEWMGTVFTNVAIDGDPLGQLSTYTYLHTELPPGVRKGDEVTGGHFLKLPTLAEIVRAEATQLPVVLFPDGSSLANPSATQLAEKLGLRVRAEMAFYDLVIVGGGPAGGPGGGQGLQGLS